MRYEREEKQDAIAGTVFVIGAIFAGFLLAYALVQVILLLMVMLGINK